MVCFPGRLRLEVAWNWTCRLSNLTAGYVYSEMHSNETNFLQCRKHELEQGSSLHCFVLRNILVDRFYALRPVENDLKVHCLTIFHDPFETLTAISK
jgi:hypothetical protein